MRLLIVAAMSIGFAAPALCQDNRPPRYDVEQYCQKVAASIGGSSQIENSCIRQEQSAYNNLKPKWPSIPTKTADYCNKVASSIGGTYQILASCIDRETDAAAKKPGFEY